MVSVVISCCHHTECRLSHVVSMLRKVQLGCCRRSSLEKAGQPDKLESRQHQSEFPCQLLHETGKTAREGCQCAIPNKLVQQLCEDTLLCSVACLAHSVCPASIHYPLRYWLLLLQSFFRPCKARTTTCAGVVVRTSFEEFFRQHETYHLGFTSALQSPWPPGATRQLIKTLSAKTHIDSSSRQL